MTLLKPLTFWLFLLSAHGCVLSSDLEMEQRLTNHWKQMQEAAINE